MQPHELMVERLVTCFPPARLPGLATSHDCEECCAIRDHLAERTWLEVEPGFVREYEGSLPLLTDEAFRLFLPAWLRVGVEEPEGGVADMLLINLGSSPPVHLFTPLQTEAIVAAASFIVAHNGRDADDPGNIESLAEIGLAWSRSDV